MSKKQIITLSQGLLCNIFVH